MALDKKLFKKEAAVVTPSGTGNQEEGLVMYLDANDVDSYDGDGSVWYDITDHEYTPATDVSEHFNTVIWTGNNASSRSITGLGFQPDLVWVKQRDIVQYHSLSDSVRGTGKMLWTNDNSSEYTTTTYGQISSFDTDGFTFNKGTDSTYSYFNANNKTYVAWCFKAGGAAVSNTDGSITSQVSANNDLGFSVVTYTGNGSTNQTVGNGLDVPADIVIVKKRNSTGNWITWHRDISAGNGKYIYLDLTNALGGPASTPVWDSANTQTNSTAGVFGINNNTNVNTNNDTYVAYCFASKRGVSKVGSYIGSTGSVKVYTGFEPAFVMIKNADVSGDPWVIFDNKRGDNGEYDYLYPSENYAEGAGDSTLNSGRTGITFNRDGFTLDDDDSHSVNESGKKHIYLAFAKNTKETSLHTTDLDLHLDPSVSGSVTTSTWSDQAGSNDGTLSGFSSTLDDFYDEELGDSILFDGSNDKIDFGTSASGVIQQVGMTVECWVNLDTNSVTSGYYTNYNNNGTDIKGFSIRITTNKRIQVDGNGTARRFREFNTNIVAGKWHHIVIVVQSNSNILCYVNGESKPQYNDANYNKHNGTIQFRSTATTRIGLAYDTSNYMDGKIGQVRVYSTELTLDQIRQNYNFTKNDYPNGYDGDFVNLTSSDWNSNGYFNFSGTNEYVDITGGNDFSSGYVQNDNIRAFTGWVRLPTASTRAILYSASSSSNGNDYFALAVRRDTSPYIYINCRDGSVSNYFLDTVNYNPDANWHHYVYQLNGEEREIYIDGVKQTVTKNNVGTATDSSWRSYPSYATSVCHAIQLGRKSSPYYGRGYISKLKFYNKALTQTEITALYNEGE